MTSYQKLIQSVNDENKYELLIDHADLVVLEVGKTSKGKVAKDFHMHAPQFTVAFNILVTLLSKQQVKQ